MLTLFGSRAGSQNQFCDRLSRRNFLTVGALGAGAAGLSLADIFRAEARAATVEAPALPAAKTGLGHKAIINIFLGGGPPHQDMWDIKTEAPTEIRGPFEPIATRVPGLQIGECFPKIAAMMDKFAVIRSVVGAKGPHDAEQCLTGWPKESLAFLGGRPSIGSALTKLRGPVDPSVPTFIGLAEPAGHKPWSDSGRPGFLGPAYAAFKPEGPGLDDMKRSAAMSLDRLSSRRDLLSRFDRMRSAIDASGSMDAVDEFGRRAFDVLTSSKLVEALDLTKEGPNVLERYGSGKPFKFQYDGSPTCNEHLLMARRLVEAGARCVTLSYGRWDAHSDNFGLVRDHGGKLDQCLTALISDLDERGILDDVTVIAWGEFGRTPRINDKAGRDHWPQVSCAILAGGGLKTGQAIGSTDRLGEAAETRPCHFQEVVATLYHSLGIDVATTTVRDTAGRPQYLLEMQQPIRELV
ncbi:MAG: DUF1501 domain-containing protein [Planctomycetaceae bacterium]|nr:DUF1501 domain-containing protein [Planctomycetaceae bacterium]